MAPLCPHLLPNVIQGKDCSYFRSSSTKDAFLCCPNIWIICIWIENKALKSEGATPVQTGIESSKLLSVDNWYVRGIHLWHTYRSFFSRDCVGSPMRWKKIQSNAFVMETLSWFYLTRCLWVWQCDGSNWFIFALK